MRKAYERYNGLGSWKIMREIIYYLFIVNVVSILFMYADKKRAIRGEYRISEKVLLGLSVMGGSLGIWFGMHSFHHKTKKTIFKYGVPIILSIQIILYIVYTFNK